MEGLSNLKKVMSGSAKDGYKMLTSKQKDKETNSYKHKTILDIAETYKIPITTSGGSAYRYYHGDDYKKKCSSIVG